MIQSRNEIIGLTVFFSFERGIYSKILNVENEVFRVSLTVRERFFSFFFQEPFIRGACNCISHAEYTVYYANAATDQTAKQAGFHWKIQLSRGGIGKA